MISRRATEQGRDSRWLGPMSGAQCDPETTHVGRLSPGVEELVCLQQLGTGNQDALLAKDGMQSISNGSVLPLLSTVLLETNSSMQNKIYSLPVS